MRWHLGGSIGHASLLPAKAWRQPWVDTPGICLCGLLKPTEDGVHLRPWRKRDHPPGTPAVTCPDIQLLLKAQEASKQAMRYVAAEQQEQKRVRGKWKPTHDAKGKPTRP